MGILLRTYRALFARPIFFRLNRLLYRLSLSGMGILNYENSRTSGERHFLSRHLGGRASCVVFDVGANRGGYSREVFEVCPQATVYAFEPHPKTFEMLEAAFDQPGFLAVNAAAGEQAGEVSLFDYMAKDGSSHASLYRDVIENIHHAESVEHKVRVLALEPFCRERQIGHIDLLKVDTEGNELAVLRGLASYLQAGKVSAIQFEFNEMNVSSRTFFRDFLELLPNYEFYRLLPSGWIPVGDYSAVHFEIFAFQNIVAILKKHR